MVRTLKCQKDAVLLVWTNHGLFKVILVIKQLTLSLTFKCSNGNPSINIRIMLLWEKQGNKTQDKTSSWSNQKKPRCILILMLQKYKKCCKKMANDQEIIRGKNMQTNLFGIWSSSNQQESSQALEFSHVGLVSI